jgi:hypothetical protein
MAKKQAKKIVVPEGYRVKVTAELPEAWDFKKVPTLRGTVQAIQRVTINSKEGPRDTRVAHVTNKDGTFGLWESATLIPFFNDLKEGQDVIVEYEGEGEAKPGRSAPKLFTAMVKD